MKPKFSVVVIARNEEKTLPRLRLSLEEFFARGGDAVLLDTGSTDRTVEMARHYGFRVEEVGDKYRHTVDQEQEYIINKQFQVGADEPIVKVGESYFDFASARNYAASLAENDFIAMPDCDEAYTKLDIDAVEATIAAGADQLCYPFVYAHDEDGNPVIEFDHCKFYNRAKMKWTGVIHEVLTGQGTPTKLPGSVIKLEHWQNVETKRGQYLTGLAIDVLENPENDRNSHYFGRELMYTGRFESTIKELNRHIAMNKWPAERSQSMIYIGDCYRTTGYFDAAIPWYMKAFQLCPNRREPFMRMAEYYYQHKDPERLIPLVAAALMVGEPESFYGNLAEYYEHLPHEMMYWALWQKGDVRGSRDHFETALGYRPFHPLYLHDLRFYETLPKVLVTGVSTLPELVYPEDKVQFGKDAVAAKDGWTLTLEEGSTPEPLSLMIALRTALENTMDMITFEGGGAATLRRNAAEAGKERTMHCYRAKIIRDTHGSDHS